MRAFCYHQRMSQTYNYLKARQEKGEHVLPERIVCAANKYQDGLIVLGVRHGCEIMTAQAKAMGREDAHAAEQGFYTNWQRWVDRNEGMRIAREQGQLYRPDGTHDDSVLFSECLY